MLQITRLAYHKPHKSDLIFDRLWLRIRCWGRKGEEVTGEWRELHTEELQNIYSSQIIEVIKSKRMGWVRACNTYGKDGKVNVLPLCSSKHHAMKTYWGSGCVAPRINFGARWRWVVSFTFRTLYLRGLITLMRMFWPNGEKVIG
jgi:hypothetical protein